MRGPPFSAGTTSFLPSSRLGFLQEGAARNIPSSGIVGELPQPIGVNLVKSLNPCIT